jgi:hypothetical protein
MYGHFFPLEENKLFQSQEKVDSHLSRSESTFPTKGRGESKNPRASGFLYLNATKRDNLLKFSRILNVTPTQTPHSRNAGKR